jgi:CYTH domain-containing protein
MAEVEGADCASFVPPSWFGREVTGDSRYDNGSLALAIDLPPLA